MERNVGGIDRTVRLVVGPVAILLGLGILVEFLPATPLIGGGLLVVGLVLLATGITQRCPIHRLLGIDTCPQT